MSNLNIWTQEENAIIREFYGKEPVAKTVKRLPSKSKQSIVYRASALGFLGETTQKISASEARYKESLLPSLLAQNVILWLGQKQPKNTYSDLLSNHG